MCYTDWGEISAAQATTLSLRKKYAMFFKTGMCPEHALKGEAKT
jgi:hypothetical protein